MVQETLQRAVPRDTPDYHERQAAHYRTLADAATTPRVKALLLKEAAEHERATEAIEEEDPDDCGPDSNRVSSQRSFPMKSSPTVTLALVLAASLAGAGSAQA